MAQSISNLALGSKIKFGKYSVNGETAQDITWIIVAKSHTGYPSNSVTLLSEYAIDKRMVDNPETTHLRGWNYYAVSNIDQWLNSDSKAGEWYSAAHSNDAPPSSGKSPYQNRPGFLNAFSAVEKQCILSTSIKSLNTSDTVATISRKVFLPSISEIAGNTISGQYEGSMWANMAGKERTVKYSSQAMADNADVTSELAIWWTRSQYTTGTVDQLCYIETDGGYNAHYVNQEYGIRPALNILSTSLVSDTLDNSGYYNLLLNTAPSAPATITPPATVYGGKSNSISWSKAIDPDGDALTYRLECSINGGTYTQIYSGASTSYAHLVPFGTTSVAYRVRATDPSGAASEYKTSTTITVINNNAPVISGADANLGVKSSGFTGTYTITDANNNSVTVTESIDGVQIRSLVATLGQAITYGITDNTWLALANGSHTLTIRATDGIDSTVRTYTFTKLVETLVIRNSTPWVSTTMPSRIMLVITRNIPSTATFKVEVCNNGYDTSPTWEDCTDAVKSGLVHVFENTKKSASNWGVLVRVTVARNGATGACYVSAIGGNFE